VGGANTVEVMAEDEGMRKRIQGKRGC